MRRVQSKFSGWPAGKRRHQDMMRWIRDTQSLRRIDDLKGWLQLGCESQRTVPLRPAVSATACTRLRKFKAGEKRVLAFMAPYRAAVPLCTAHASVSLQGRFTQPRQDRPWARRCEIQTPSAGYLRSGLRSSRKCGPGASRTASPVVSKLTLYQCVELGSTS